MKDLFLAKRKFIIVLFLLLTGVMAIFALRLQFSFSFEQFFPKGDEDLEFFQEFTSEFETDDNFLLVAVENEGGIFDSVFLKKFHDFSIDCKGLPHVVKSQSLTQIKYPLKTPFGTTTVPAIHLNNPEKYPQDKKILLEDERFAETLLNKDCTSAIVTIKNIETIGLEESQELVTSLQQLIQAYGFDNHYILGRAYFSKELVDIQLKEVIISTIVSMLLLLVVMFLLYRKAWSVFVGLISIAMAMTIFFGLLGLLKRELNIMSALYPVLMLIVGTSDVIHIMTKYLDELKKGNSNEDAIWVTIKEIGLATFLTSVTTAVGFMSLMSSRITPVSDFGLNAGIGVVIAYIVVVLFTTAVLSLLPKEKLVSTKGSQFWDKLMIKSYTYGRRNPKNILFSGFIITLLCFIGMSQITTNYKIESNLPRKGKVTTDFKYFEKNYGGFRPMEFAITSQGSFNALDFEVQREIERLENKLRTEKKFSSIASVTMMQKSIERMNGRNKVEAYNFPQTKKRFERNQKMLKNLPNVGNNVLISKDLKKARISTRISDIGADNISLLGKNLDQWIKENINLNIISVRRTGTGVLVDKNAHYVRESLIYGLGLALGIISLLMGLLYKDVKMLVISLIPNIFPLLFAAALMGFIGVEMEAGISIVFAIVFGIAVDDTIHFLSKFKLAKSDGLSTEEALKVTFVETGKAITLTTIVLFFGFLVMLFSSNPGSVNVGLLISTTLISAVVCDLTLLPLLLRRFIK